MPHGDMGVDMNKARLAEAGRGTYPIGMRCSKEHSPVDVWELHVGS